MISQAILDDALAYGRAFVAEGNTAQYIPELRNVNKYHLGICVKTVEGEELSSGDTDTAFTIQSISKLVSLILAVRDRGADYLFNDKVGVEPTGDPFNSIVRLETKSKPYNPFINAGAIVIASCVEGANADEKFERFLAYFRRLCGSDKIDLNHAVYESEKATGDKNRALAYHLKATHLLDGDVEDSLDFYFRMCSVAATARDIAHMSLVLANNGVDPESGERHIEAENAKAIRALMLTCGMYDGSGEFAVTVGFPAKSGVGGGIAAALVDRMGIGVYGPSLNEKGNSIGGIKMLEYLSKKLDLSLF